MSGKIIETHALTKDYGGGRGIFDVNLSVSEGEMLGFVGTNGSGKTTTIRSVLGFIRPTSGVSSVCGLESWKHSPEIVKKVGYVPGEIAFPDMPTGTAFLKSQAEFMGLKDMRRAGELINLLQLDTDAGLKRMSKGMKQKTAIVAALMNDPEIIILDEPTTGLDPLMRDAFLDIIRDEHRRGKTVIMSSHMFEELEVLCDKVALISDGRIISEVSMNDIRNPEKREYKVEFMSPEGLAAFEAKGLPVVRRQPQYNQATVRIDTGDADLLFAALKGSDIKFISEVKYNLERYFMKNISASGKKGLDDNNVQ